MKADVTPAPHSAATTGSAAVASAAILSLAAVDWVVAVHQMDGMDMGVSTELGSLGLFVAAWVPMMAAMMLPGAVPAVSKRVRREGRARGIPLFVTSYLAVWTAVGLAVYAVYRPHGTAVAGALVVASGLYELTPIKRTSRRRCQESVRSGFELGLFCLGSSIGLMVMFLALGAMSTGWMAVVAVLVLAQKLVPPRGSLDVPLALAIVGLGTLAVVSPSSIPGLTPPM
jgi:predicted metal-binding membrane protein